MKLYAKPQQKKKTLKWTCTQLIIIWFIKNISSKIFEGKPYCVLTVVRRFSDELTSQPRQYSQALKRRSQPLLTYTAPERSDANTIRGDAEQCKNNNNNNKSNTSYLSKWNKRCRLHKWGMMILSLGAFRESGTALYKSYDCRDNIYFRLEIKEVIKSILFWHYVYIQTMVSSFTKYIY